jgi:hypothetical protein
MKLNYYPLLKCYKVEGNKSFTEKECTKEAKVQLLIEPRMPSLFSNSQKRKFRRQPIDQGQNLTVLDSFLKDSSEILKEFELEFDSRGVPYKLINHQEIGKKWLYYVDVLKSKYSGEWINKEIEWMTHRITESEILLKTLLDDFLFNELYGRKIYKTTFDNKTNAGRRNWIETVWGIPLEFYQEYEAQTIRQEDYLWINGKLDLNANKLAISQLCAGKQFDPEDITSMEQKTTYTAKDITYIPNRIESVFSINGKNECLEKIEIQIMITEMKRDE